VLQTAANKCDFILYAADCNKSDTPSPCSFYSLRVWCVAYPRWITLFYFIYLLVIRNNTTYKLMWWLYKLRYDTMYYNDVVGYSSSDVTSGALQVQRPASF